MFTEDEINKLPKWAQNKVKTLQMRLNEAKKELERINTNTPSNTMIGFISSIHDDHPVYLRENQLITFKLNDSDYIMARIENGELDINGNNSLITIHKVSNNFHIKINK